VLLAERISRPLPLLAKPPLPLITPVIVAAVEDLHSTLVDRHGVSIVVDRIGPGERAVGVAILEIKTA
jgi:hypothetical protein